MSGEILVGRLTTGAGWGSYFTQINWARRQFVEKLGLDPFPGTLNLIAEDARSLGIWNSLKDTPGVRIDNPDEGPRSCDARCYPVSIDGLTEAAIVLPEVAGYSPVQVEIISAVGIRDVLGIDDGDLLRLTIRQIAI
jgi:CTP-dependent riboflavin kinase